jgi:hypothetical protein
MLLTCQCLSGTQYLMKAELKYVTRCNILLHSLQDVRKSPAIGHGRLPVTRSALLLTWNQDTTLPQPSSYSGCPGFEMGP